MVSPGRGKVGVPIVLTFISGQFFATLTLRKGGDHMLCRLP